MCQAYPKRRLFCRSSKREKDVLMCESFIRIVVKEVVQKLWKK